MKRSQRAEQDHNHGDGDCQAMVNQPPMTRSVRIRRVGTANAEGSLPKNRAASASTFFPTNHYTPPRVSRQGVYERVIR